MTTMPRKSWSRPFGVVAIGAVLATALPSAAAAADLPAPSLSRTASPDGRLTVGQPVHLTLTARNAGTGVSFDSRVVECASPGLVVSDVEPAATVAVAGCPNAGTRIEWALGDLAPGAMIPLNYTAVPESVTVAGTIFTTHGQMTSLSAPFVRENADSDVPEGIAVREIQSHRPLTYGLPTVTQAVVPLAPAPGDTVTFTLVSTVPAGVGMGNAVVRDLMPVGFDLDRLTTLAVSCVDSDGEACALHDTSGEHHVNDERLVTWNMGHFWPAAVDRVITVVLSVPVAADADAVLRNRSGMQWSDHPSIVGRAGFRGGATASTTVVVGPPAPGTSQPTSPPVPTQPEPAASESTTPPSAPTDGPSEPAAGGSAEVPAGQTGGPATPTSTALALTGVDVASWVSVALGAFLAGAGFTVAGRRRTADLRPR